MKKSVIRWQLLVLLFSLFSFTIIACKGKGKNKDGAIQTALNEKTRTDASFAGVTSTVSEGTVTLTGTCNDEDCRNRAEKAAKDVDGVKKVVNNIAVARVEVADDGSLRRSVEEAIDDYEGVQADVNNGVITLRGTIDNREKLARLLPELHALRPQRVENQLVIKK
jgi:osmotically-inducible protein OsmY